ncbi:MAG: hypothetical protein RMA76_31950 [Deltaproteobacteria bacterium]|jgi:hypothetical protein
MRFPPALPHGPVEEVLDGVFFVTGTAAMGGPVAIRFSRNMTIFRRGRSLTIVNSMRLNDVGLEELDRLGKVDHVVRIAGFHGLDDAFYRDRYGAKLWAVEGQAYAKGFTNANVRPEDGYLQPDVWMTPDTELPIDDARLIVLRGLVPEGMIYVDRHDGLLVSGDCLQNYGVTDRYFSTLGALVMRFMGFIKPHNVGPGWLKGAKPNKGDVRALLDLEFDHVLPVHGVRVIGGAKEKYRPAIERL